MKLKILYALIVVLILMIVLTIFINRATKEAMNSIEPVLKSAETQEAVQPQGAPMAPSPQAVVAAPAITFIQPPQNQEPGRVPKEVVDEAKKPRKSSPAPSVQSPASGASLPAKEPEPGITVIGKYPSEKENKDMNERGIILY